MSEPGPREGLFRLRPLSGLQRRFFASVASLVAGLMITTLLVVAGREGRLIRAEAEKRAVAVARNLAATTDTALRIYNYVALEQAAEKAAREAHLSYVIFFDKEGRVAAFSGHDELQHSRLDDPVSRRAQEVTEPLVQETVWGPPGEPPERVLDVSVPVIFRESTERWGTVRIGLSLEPLRAQVRRTQLALLALATLALALAAIGVHLSARRITRPIELLAAGARQLASGRLGVQVEIKTGDELEALAAAFNQMSAELATKQAALERHLQDLTNLKRYQDDILRSMDEGLLTIDPEERIVTANRVAMELLVIGPGIAAEHPPLEAIVGAREPLMRIVRAGLHGGETVTNVEIELQRGTRTVPLGVSTAPLLDAEGNRLGLLVLLRELSRLKDLEARVRRADKLAALGTMAAGLAHEIRNPLAAIKTFVQLVPQRFDNPAFREKFGVTVPRELDRVNGIVENLLELARTPRLNFAPTDLNELLRRVLDLHSRQLEERGIALELSLAEDLPPALADAEYLMRAFSNLVVNAIQAMPEGGRLSVKSRRADRPAPGRPAMAAVCVADTGIGMDEETVRNLFNPFFTTKAKGTGLGLALTHKIVEEHRGTITVRSRRGAGSEFEITLPLADGTA
ncbi:MAG TPA: ATP-binding protein [Thermodesulfobacteriota bacterium]|nr:ATP-binding protein [Thermodesulfobacteriota bacterium]